MPGKQGLTVAEWDAVEPRTETTFRYNPPKEVPATLRETVVDGPRLSLFGLQEFARDFNALPLNQQSEQQLSDYLQSIADAIGEKGTAELRFIGLSSDEDHELDPNDPLANTGKSSPNNERLALGRGERVKSFAEKWAKDHNLEDRIIMNEVTGKEVILSPNETAQLIVLADNYGNTLANILTDFDNGAASYLSAEHQDTFDRLYTQNRGAVIDSTIKKVEVPQIGTCDRVVTLESVPPTQIDRYFPGRDPGSIDLMLLPVLAGWKWPTKKKRDEHEDSAGETPEPTPEKPMPRTLTDEELAVRAEQATKHREYWLQRSIRNDRIANRLVPALGIMAFLLVPFLIKDEYKPAENPEPAAQACTTVEVRQGGERTYFGTSVGEIILAWVQGRDAVWTPTDRRTKDTVIATTVQPHTKWIVDEYGRVVTKKEQPAVTTEQNVPPVIP